MVTLSMLKVTHYSLCSVQEARDYNSLLPRGKQMTELDNIDEFGAIEAEATENDSVEDVVSSIGIAVDPMAAALQRATGGVTPRPLTQHARERVQLVDGKLVKVVEYTNEDIYKKLVDIEKKLDTLLGGTQATVKMEIK